MPLPENSIILFYWTALSDCVFCFGLRQQSCPSPFYHLTAEVNSAYDNSLLRFELPRAPARAAGAASKVASRARRGNCPDEANPSSPRLDVLKISAQLRRRPESRPPQPGRPCQLAPQP